MLHRVSTPLYGCTTSILLNWLLAGAAFAEPSGILPGAGFEWAATTGGAQVVTVTRDGSGLCNSVAFSQIPGHRDLFLGRVKQNTGPDKCSGDNWSIALFKMNWDRRELSFVRDVLEPPFSIPGDGRVIQSAYDPYTSRFNGQMWVAFECAAPESVSSCVGPLDLDNGVDVSRVSVPVSGGPKSGSDAWRVSASDPKLLLFREHLYLYWTVIRSDEHGWIDGTSRGTQLVSDDQRQARLWTKNAVGRPVRANDGKLTAEVWSPKAGDSASNSFVDIFGIYASGNSIFAIAARGGKGDAPGEKCLSPAGNSFGCFRVSISTASEPLGNHVFDTAGVHTVEIPQNPQEYSRIVEGPDGRLFMMGQYFDPPAKYEARYQGHTVARGLMLYPISIK